MRFHEFEPLNEVNMSPSSLLAFAKSDAAAGMMAGFEAELVFDGRGTIIVSDERCDGIQDAIDFFDTHFELDLTEEIDELFRDAEDEAWKRQQEDLIKERIEESDWDKNAAILEYLKDEYSEDTFDEIVKVHSTPESEWPKNGTSMYRKWEQCERAYEDASKSVVAARVQESVLEQDDVYADVYEEFQRDFDSEFDLSTEYGIKTMRDVARRFDIEWPSESEFDLYDAEYLADDLSENLGVPTKASDTYHGVERDEVTWIFEPDTSVKANAGTQGLPVEIISPPMPIGECLVKMDKFFDWVHDQGGYSNSTTGMHMSVSVPNHDAFNVDFVKAVLFLGDAYVLEKFGREANTFAKSSINELVRYSEYNRDINPLEVLKKGLDRVAKNIFKIDNYGFDKRYSVNPHSGYVEFRSAGGEDYSSNVKEVQNALLRYVRVLSIATDPEAYRREYYKKLYKLLAPSGDTAIDLFAQYAAGLHTVDTLKLAWANMVKRAEKKNGVGKVARSELATKFETPRWVIVDNATGNESKVFQAQNARMAVPEALKLAKSLGWNGNFLDKYSLAEKTALGYTRPVHPDHVIRAIQALENGGTGV